jgi:sugar phosphate isomerase/epimerase
MRAAISTVCMSDTGWREALATAAAAGYAAVEVLMIPGWVHLQPDPAVADDLALELARLRLRLIGVHAGGIDGTTDDALTPSLAYVRRAIAFAARFPGAFVNVNGMPVPAGTGAADRAAMLARIARGLRELAPDLERHDVRLTLENHCRFQIETLADYLALFAAPGVSQRIGATVDTGHCTASRVDIPALVRRLGARVSHVHLKDHLGERSVGLGHGETDNRGAVRALKDVGYCGSISVELEVHDREHNARYIREALPYVEGLIASA